MTKEEIYKQIRESSKDSFILEDMKRLGFWNENDMPKLSVEILNKKVTLEKKLREIRRAVKEPKSILKEIHKHRMKRARERREETKLARELREREREKLREKRKKEEIGFIGKDYLKTLKIDKDIDKKKLESQNLPVISSPKELALFFEISLKELRFLTYTSKLSKRSHYIKFKIKKKRGGFRDISAPMPKLKNIQEQILEKILYKIPVHKRAFGFVKEKNIVLNASLHIDKKVVINRDLENFFPTITFERVIGLFKSFGYSTQIATLFAILLTEPEQKKIRVDEEEFLLNIGKRLLPQGSPASPMVSNLICRRLDSRLFGVAKKLGFEYSRYADDLSFSSNSYEKISQMLFWSKKIVKEEGFNIHPEKTEVMRENSTQRVTGVVVNEKLSIPRRDLKRFRALLHQIEKDGLEGKNWNGKSKNLISSIWGYANFINMVDSKKGEIYIERVKNIAKREKEKLEEIENRKREEEKRKREEENRDAKELADMLALLFNDNKEDILKLFEDLDNEKN